MGAGLTRSIGTDANGNPIVRQYHTDGQGSVLAITDGLGNPVTNYQIDAWGNVLSGSAPGNAFDFLGGLGYWSDPDLGLHYVRARWLNPAFGSWMSPDPHLDEFAYQYANNMPTTATDSSGKGAGKESNLDIAIRILGGRDPEKLTANQIALIGSHLGEDGRVTRDLYVTEEGAAYLMALYAVRTGMRTAHANIMSPWAWELASQEPMTNDRPAQGAKPHGPSSAPDFNALDPRRLPSPAGSLAAGYHPFVEQRQQAGKPFSAAELAKFARADEAINRPITLRLSEEQREFRQTGIGSLAQYGRPQSEEDLRRARIIKQADPVGKLATAATTAGLLTVLAELDSGPPGWFLLALTVGGAGFEYSQNYLQRKRQVEAMEKAGVKGSGTWASVVALGDTGGLTGITDYFLNVDPISLADVPDDLAAQHLGTTATNIGAYAGYRGAAYSARPPSSWQPAWPKIGMNPESPLNVNTADLGPLQRDFYRSVAAKAEADFVIVKSEPMKPITNKVSGKTYPPRGEYHFNSNTITVNSNYALPGTREFNDVVLHELFHVWAQRVGPQRLKDFSLDHYNNKAAWMMFEEFAAEYMRTGKLAESGNYGAYYGRLDPNSTTAVKAARMAFKRLW